MEISPIRHLSDADDARLKVVVRGSTFTVSGSGVWLGNGKVLTAAHLFMGRKDGASVDVIIHRHTLTGTLLSHGDFGTFDLALIEVPLEEIPKDVAAIPFPALCNCNEVIGAQLYVVAHDQSHETTASPEHAIQDKGRLWSTATTATLSHGVSGAGVFDARTGCLAGIVSRSVSDWHITFNADENRKCIQAIVENANGPPDITCEFDAPTLFVPATRISEFLQRYGRIAGTSGRPPM